MNNDKDSLGRDGLSLKKKDGWIGRLRDGIYESRLFTIYTSYAELPWQ
jgi:hypothetical protein